MTDYTYSGDYEDLIDWIIDTYPPSMYAKEGFNSWLKDVKKDFLNSGHHFSDDLKDEMRQFWIDNNLGKLGTPDKDDRKINRAKTFNEVRELGLFTTKDAYDYNQDRKQASVRRELQELVKEGKIERVSRGVYSIK